MNLTLQAIYDAGSNAICPEDIFGDDYRKVYRNLVKVCHPDVVDLQDKPDADRVMGIVTKWKSIADDRARDGTYGQRLPVTKPRPPYTESELTVGKDSFTLIGELGSGSVSSVHEAKLKGGDPNAQFIIKIAKNPSDNDLMEREFKNLVRITTPDINPDKEKFYQMQRMYVPHPVRSFKIQGANKKQHAVNALVIPGATHYSVKELMAMPKFRNGIGRDHASWIFRRLLLTLFMAHEKGIVHGMVTPDHVLIYPKDHGLVLTGWTGSCAIGTENVKMYDSDYKSFNAPEIKNKKHATAATDIFQAAQLSLLMRGASATDDKEVFQFMRKCLDIDQSHRPQNALDLHDEFGKLLEKLYGKRKYVEFVV